MDLGCTCLLSWLWGSVSPCFVLFHFRQDFTVFVALSGLELLRSVCPRNTWIKGMKHHA